MFSPSWVWWLRTSSPWSPRREPFRRKTEVVWSIMGCRNVVGEPFMLTTRRRDTLIPRREEKHPTQCALSPIQENLKTAECPQPSLPGDYNLGDIFPGPQWIFWKYKDYVTITASWLGRLKGCASLLQSAHKWIGIQRTQVSPSSEDGLLRRSRLERGGSSWHQKLCDLNLRQSAPKSHLEPSPFLRHWLESPQMSGNPGI